MNQRELPSITGEEKTVAECVRDLEGVLADLRRALYKPVFEQGQALDPALKSFVMTSAALLHALHAGDANHLREAGKLAKGYVGTAPRYLADAAPESEKARHRLLEIPRDLLETRASTMDLLRDLVAGALRNLSDPSAKGPRTHEQVAAILVDLLVDDPIVIAPFLESSQQQRHGTKAKLVATDYFVPERRAAALTAACGELQSAPANVNEIDMARSAITAALRALDFSGEPFSYEKHRERK